MAKKKNTKIAVSQEDNIQAQPILEHYQRLAKDLRGSADQQQAESVLGEINTLPERVQIALLKALVKEHTTDAADVLAGVGELSPMKEVRKEARRALIQLEGARIYPQWQPVAPQALITISSLTTPPRFWKGMVTDSRNAGEAQLVLCWDQGNDEIRMLSFLLEFWHDGVKDFFMNVGSRRSAEKLIDTMAEAMPDVVVKPCSLAQGRRLLLDALAVNKQYGTAPYKDFRNNLSLVNRLILEVPGLEEVEEDAPLDEHIPLTLKNYQDLDVFDQDDDDENDEDFDLKSLLPQQIVAHFVDALFDEYNFERAYNILAKDSPLREGLAQDAWIERREEWLDEADPEDLAPGLVREREQQKSGLWLPFSKPRTSGDRKEIETFWSAEIQDLASDRQIPELPAATAIYEGTGRHWFWATYTLVKEEEAWHIESMRDESLDAQALTIEELQKRISDLDRHAEDLTKKLHLSNIKRLKEDDLIRFSEELSWHLQRSAGYSDALIKKLPLDRSLYEEAAGRMLLAGQIERRLMYVAARAYRFQEQRAIFLRRTAEIQLELSTKYREVGNTKQAENILDLAKKALEECLAIDDGFESHIALVEVLLEESRFDEAEAHLLQVQALASDPSQVAHVEMHLGEIAVKRKEYEEALSHYQRVAEIQPDLVDSWANLADVYDQLGRLDEAETHFRHALKIEPENTEIFSALAHMYIRHAQHAKAIEILDEGLSEHPESAMLYMYLATVYVEDKDYSRAEQCLDKAEQLGLDPGTIEMFRQTLNTLKARAASVSAPPQTSRPGIPARTKKKR